MIKDTLENSSTLQPQWGLKKGRSDDVPHSARVAKKGKIHSLGVKVRDLSPSTTLPKTKSFRRWEVGEGGEQLRGEEKHSSFFSNSNVMR